MGNLLLIAALSLQTEGSEKIADCFSKRVEKETLKHMTGFRMSKQDDNNG